MCGTIKNDIKVRNNAIQEWHKHFIAHKIRIKLIKPFWFIDFNVVRVFTFVHTPKEYLGFKIGYKKQTVFADTLSRKIACG